MMRLILCLVLIGGSAWADDNKVSTGDAKTDAAVVDVQDKRRDITMCQARVVTVYHVMDQEVEEVSDAFFKAPNKMFVGVSKDGKWVPSLVSDPGMLWTYDAEENMVTKFNRGRIYRETELEVDAYMPDPLRPFRGVVWASIRFVGNETVSEKVEQMFEAQLKPNLLSAQLPSALVKVKLGLSDKDGLLRSVRAFDADNNLVVMRRFEDMRVDAKIKDVLFEFVIPAGAHVMDGTGEAIQVLQSLAEAENKGRIDEK